MAAKHERNKQHGSTNRQSMLPHVPSKDVEEKGGEDDEAKGGSQSQQEKTKGHLRFLLDEPQDIIEKSSKQEIKKDEEGEESEGKYEEEEEEEEPERPKTEEEEEDEGNQSKPQKHKGKKDEEGEKKDAKAKEGEEKASKEEDKKGSEGQKGGKSKKTSEQEVEEVSKILPDVSSKDIVVSGEEEERELDDDPRNVAEQESTTGFVSRLFDFVLPTELRQQDEEPDKTERKSISLEDQSQEEREISLKEAESDIIALFEKKKQPSSRPKASKKSVSQSSMGKLPVVQTTARTKDTLIVGGISKAPTHLKSKWVPGGEEELAKVGFHQRVESWVGSYIVGFDYWTKQERDSNKEKRIQFTMDEGSTPWYDMPFEEDTESPESFQERREISKGKIDDLKMKTPKHRGRANFEEQREVLAYGDKKPISDKWRYELKEMFEEFARNDLNSSRDRLSLSNIDSWMENVGLVDHNHFTLIHTGLCYKGAGGSRFKGLNLDEFITFLDMVADTRKMPLNHVIVRLKLAILDVKPEKQS